MESRHFGRAIALAAIVGVLGAGAVSPAEARRLSPPPSVDLGTAANLAPDGRSMSVGLIVRCPERWTVVEAFVTVSQPQASGTAPFTVPCTGSLTPVGVTVPSSGAPFELGAAQATATLVIQRGRTERVTDSEVLTVQPSVFVDLAGTARIQSGGSAASIAITVACPVGATGVQSYVNISQGQASGNGQYVPVCDGLSHTFDVLVQADRGSFQTGSAQALTFANTVHEGMLFAGVDDGTIQLVS
jgi:hypothetical protein